MLNDNINKLNTDQQIAHQYMKLIPSSLIVGEVVEEKDPNEAGRLKIRIPNLDDFTEDNSLPWASSLLPRFVAFSPKKGEAVWVVIPDTSKYNSNRLWIGPIISQYQNINEENFQANGLNSTSTPYRNLKTGVNNIPDAIGIFPTIEEQGILGRNNADLIFRKNEFELRSGKHITDNNISSNKTNPVIFKGKLQENNKESYIYQMSDKVLILTHKSDTIFEKNLSDAEFTDLFNKSHPVVKGDILVELLEIIRKALTDHVHGYSNAKADPAGIINRLNQFSIESILQTNIRIN